MSLKQPLALGRRAVSLWSNIAEYRSYLNSILIITGQISTPKRATAIISSKSIADLPTIHDVMCFITPIRHRCGCKSEERSCLRSKIKLLSKLWGDCTLAIQRSEKTRGDCSTCQARRKRDVNGIVFGAFMDVHRRAVGPVVRRL
jgi:hypothetical protein